MKKKEKVRIWGLLTKDAYLDLEKCPPHLAEITLSLEEFEKIIEERLNKLSIEFAKCKECGKKIFFLPTKAGKQMPVTLGLISHFADCPSADKFRRNSKS